MKKFTIKMQRGEQIIHPDGSVTDITYGEPAKTKHIKLFDKPPVILCKCKQNLVDKQRPLKNIGVIWPPSGGGNVILPTPGTQVQEEDAEYFIPFDDPLIVGGITLLIMWGVPLLLGHLGHFLFNWPLFSWY